MALPTQVGNMQTGVEVPGDRLDKRCLLDLPNELVIMIMANISRRKDLLSAMKTCRRLRDAGSLPLYRHICLNLNEVELPWIQTIVDPSSIGPKTIKTISLNNKSVRYPGDYEFWPLRTWLPDLFVQRLLQALPRHSLTDFDWTCIGRFEVRNFELLLTTQNKIKHLEALNLTDYTPLLHQALSNANLENVQKLTLNTSFGHGNLLLGNQLVQQAHNVRHLTVTSTRRQPWDGMTADPYTHSVLFQHFFQTGPANPLPHPRIGLTHLHLSKVTFRASEDVYGAVIELSMLNCVHLDHCINTQVFMSTLQNAGRQLQDLTMLVVRHGEDRRAVVTLALEALLKAIEGLETLIVDFGRSRDLLAIESILRHRKTLRTLAVHGYLLTRRPSSSQERVYREIVLRMLADECRDLERLSIGLRPPVTGRSRDRQPDHWTRMYPLLCKLPRLRVLHITPAPFRNEDSNAGAVVSLQMYPPLVKAIAKKCFKKNMMKYLWNDAHLRTVRFGRDDLDLSLLARNEVSFSHAYVKHSGRAWIDEDRGQPRFELDMSFIDIEELRGNDLEDQFLNF